MLGVYLNMKHEIVALNKDSGCNSLVLNSFYSYAVASFSSQRHRSSLGCLKINQYFFFLAAFFGGVRNS